MIFSVIFIQCARYLRELDGKSSPNPLHASVGIGLSALACTMSVPRGRVEVWVVHVYDQSDGEAAQQMLLRSFWNEAKSWLVWKVWSIVQGPQCVIPALSAIVLSFWNIMSFCQLISFDFQVFITWFLSINRSVFFEKKAFFLRMGMSGPAPHSSMVKDVP